MGVDKLNDLRQLYDVLKLVELLERTDAVECGYWRNYITPRRRMIGW